MGDRVFNNKIADFIPIACHFNEHTLLTKNGELIQIVATNGYVSTDNTSLQNSIRDIIRSAYKGIFAETNVALYTYVLCRKEEKDSSYQDFPSSIAASVEREWQQYNQWNENLSNVLYIAIVHSGIKGHISASKAILSLGAQAFIRKYMNKLDAALEELNEVSLFLNEKLSIYQSSILTIKQNAANQYYSEPLSFFYELLHLRSKEVLIEEMDASKQLATLDIEYGFNWMELSSEGEKKKMYVNVLTLKHLYHLPQQISDMILQMSHQFMITESVVQLFSQEYVDFIERQKEIYEMGGSSDIGALSGLNDILLSYKEKNRLCKGQTSLVIFNEDELRLKERMIELSEVLNKIGIAVIREDCKMAQTFFSRLPGNFHLLCRESDNVVENTANFSLIHHQDIGFYNGSKWGPPVSILKNLNGYLYYFNFHYGDNGNTLIFGPKNAGAKSMMRFLIAQSTRLRPNLIIIHTDPDKKDFIYAMDGKVVKLGLDKKSENDIQYDIFNIDNFSGNIEYLLGVLVDDVLHSNNVKDDVKAIKGVVGEWVAEKDHTKRTEMIAAFQKKKLGNSVVILTKLQQFLNSDKYKMYYKDDKSLDLEGNSVINIDASKSYSSSPEIRLILGLFLMKLPDMLNNQPTIIAVNNCDFLFSMEAFKHKVSDWLEQLTKINAIALLSSNNKKLLLGNEVMQKAIHSFATCIFMGDRFADYRLQRALDITKSELYRLKSYDRSHRAFMLKQGGSSVFSSFDLAKSPELLKLIGQQS